MKNYFYFLIVSSLSLYSGNQQSRTSLEDITPPIQIVAYNNTRYYLSIVPKKGIGIEELSPKGIRPLSLVPEQEIEITVLNHTYEDEKPHLKKNGSVGWQRSPSATKMKKIRLTAFIHANATKVTITSKAETHDIEFLVDEEIN